MDRFLSNFTNRLDTKGRVSVPASFRAVLARDGFEGVYVHPSLDVTACDAGGNALLGEIETVLNSLPAYSDERDHLSTALFGTSEVLKLDADGRIVVSDAIRQQTGLADAVTFVGLGHKFQIWEPEAFRAHLALATTKVREIKRALGAASR